jgi:hypothetical protein
MLPFLFEDQTREKVTQLEVIEGAHRRFLLDRFLQKVARTKKKVFFKRLG